jgi:biotin synthase-related radical SAM superfamily protein
LKEGVFGLMVRLKTGIFNNLEEKMNTIELKAKMLCEGVNPDEAAEELFRQQNPSGVKRGGLSSGGKMRLSDNLVVNAPFYREKKVDLKVVADSNRKHGVLIQEEGRILCEAEVLLAPDWYDRKVGDFEITQVLTAHNRQLAGAVYEDCVLFARGEQCQFCVINRSLAEKRSELIRKKANLILAALAQIPVDQYGGLSLNGGMTLHSGRGMELFESVIQAVHAKYPDLPIAVEITPPVDLNWVDRLAEAGMASLMMNLECWDQEIRSRILPGKSKYCSRDQYLAAFERSLSVLGSGRVTTCFVVGTEPVESLKKGISEIIRLGVIPSPLAGRYFEDIPNYPFVPDVDWREFLGVLRFAGRELARTGVRSMDKAGCVACGMCDLIKDL